MSRPHWRFHEHGLYHRPMPPHAGQPVATVGAPLGQSGAAMIMLHGRRASPANILDLVPRLKRPSWTYLAPAAANNTWYPYSFMPEISTNEPAPSSALRVLERLVDDVKTRGLRQDRIVLLGFS